MMVVGLHSKWWKLKSLDKTYERLIGLYSDLFPLLIFLTFVIEDSPGMVLA